MTKRLRLWIKELNLSQQLLTIIFMSATFLAVFFFVYLSETINDFVDNEMYSMLHRTQQSILYSVEEDSWVAYNDPLVTNILIDTKTGTMNITNSSSNQIMLEAVVNQAKRMTEKTKDYVYVNGKTRVLYSVCRIDKNTILVSLMSENYRTEYRDALLNSVINLSGTVIGALFIILMIWVGSLIHPLNQIRVYVDKVRHGEDAVLKIDRRDEIGEVATALIDMRKELSRQEQSKEEMIQNISHDLKTPIATIKSYAESIKDGIYPYDSLEKSVDVIIEHAGRLEKKVYSLLMLNRMGYLSDVAEEGNTLDMVEVINKVVLSMEAMKSDVNITTVLNPVKFHGEEEPWRIVVENLLDNCMRYAKSEIVITLNEDELEISNDGPLLSKERQEKLFKPYEKGTDGKFGLGLSIVYRVVTTYGYRVSAENLEDGVLFRIHKSTPSKKPDLKKVEK